ncbi:MAG: GntR family transcriptional regulator [Dorea sp.]|nr:GntR family transcriptional regulator [Dorea sp.]
MALKNNYMKPINVKTTVDIVVDRLTQAIIDGDLKAGDRLPSEAELAANFAVGRNTIREAVRILIAYGILEIRRPEGTFVCDTFKESGINPMLYSMILKKDDSYEELVSLRQCIEVGIVQLLSRKGASEKYLKLLEEAVADIVTAVQTKPVDTKKILNADVHFHEVLAQATSNNLIVSTNDMVVKLSLGSRRQTIEYIMEHENGQYLIDTHTIMLECVKSRDFSAMCDVLEDSYRYWKDINENSDEEIFEP